jgi:hypothetical protein
MFRVCDSLPVAALKGRLESRFQQLDVFLHAGRLERHHTIELGVLAPFLCGLVVPFALLFVSLVEHTGDVIFAVHHS